MLRYSFKRHYPIDNTHVKPRLSLVRMGEPVRQRDRGPQVIVAGMCLVGMLLIGVVCAIWRAFS
jgi:hypothetical protein